MAGRVRDNSKTLILEDRRERERERERERGRERERERERERRERERGERERERERAQDPATTLRTKASKLAHVQTGQVIFFQFNECIGGPNASVERFSEPPWTVYSDPDLQQTLGRKAALGMRDGRCLCVGRCPCDFISVASRGSLQG